MTDAEKIFNQTVQERKRIARGAKNKLKGGGRAVRLPSDNLTKKEREAMNGETVTYKVHSPVKWPEFKRWPPDIQREYFKRLDTSYRPTAEMYAEMFEIGVAAIGRLRAQLGIKTGKRGRSLPFYDGWQRFMSKGADEEEKETPSEEKPLTIHNECEHFAREQAEQPDIEPNGYTIQNALADREREEIAKIDAVRLAALLQSLSGTGAKMTIEVTL